MSLDLLTNAAESLPIVSTRILGLVAGLVVLLLALSALIRAYRQGDPPARWLDESEEPQAYIDRYRRVTYKPTGEQHGSVTEFKPRKKGS